MEDEASAELIEGESAAFDFGFILHSTVQYSVKPYNTVI